MSEKIPSTAAQYFGGMRDSYDSLIRRAVPRYEELTDRLVAYLPERADRVLELGCGTGNLSLALAARYPEAELTLVDASAEMVELSKARVAATRGGGAPRVRGEVCRFEELRPAPGSFDLVVSSISLHHVVDKGALFRRIREWLVPGGSLRFADQMRGGSEWNHAHNWARWLAFCRAPGNCTEEEVQSLLDHAQAHDHYVSVPDHLRALEAAGFVNLDCVWRDGMWAVLTADAP